MTVLSNNKRRLVFGWFSWSNIQFQWTVVGIVGGLLIAGLALWFQTFSWSNGAFAVAITIIGTIFAAQFLWAALWFDFYTRNPERRSFFVKRWERLKWLYWEYYTYGEVTHFKGTAVIERRRPDGLYAIYRFDGVAVALRRDTGETNVPAWWPKGEDIVAPEVDPHRVRDLSRIALHRTDLYG